MGEMVTKSIYNFREEQGRDRVNGPALQEKVKKTAQSERAIKCKTCGWTITAENQKTAINDSHTHTFFNPAGIVFELACFHKAPGCLVAGEATTEFTWFSGYLWRYALCQNCQNHLGWFYEGRDRSFFGLILQNLTQ